MQIFFRTDSCFTVHLVNDLDYHTSIHRLWSNFESGGHLMRVKRARGRIAPKEGVGGELATKLGTSNQN